MSTQIHGTEPARPASLPFGTQVPNMRASTDTRHMPGIDIIKGIAILGVLVIHARFDRFHPSALATISLAALLLQWSVLAFFFTAGQLAKLPATSGEFFEFARARAARLLIPFVAFTLFYKILFAIMNRPGGLDWLQPAFQLYFLPYLFLISVAAAGWCLLAPGPFGKLAILVLLLLGSGMVIRPNETMHGPSFELLGVYGASYFAGLCVRDGRPTLTLTVVGLGSMLASGWSHNLHLLTAVVPPVLQTILLRTEVERFLTFWRPMGRHSAAIFVWHTPVVMPALSIISVRVAGAGLLAVILTLLSTLFVSLVLGCCTARYSWLRFLRL